MNVKDALATIKDIEKPIERGSVQIVRITLGVKGKMIKLLGW